MRNRYSIITMKRSLSLALFGWIMTLASAQAAELPLFYEGIRPLGMGGAFTAVADDENAIFYNPAGLNQIDGFGGTEILNPYLEISRDTLSFFNDLKDVSDAGTDSEQLNLAINLLDDFFGKNLHLRSGLFPNLIFHNFGVGILAQGVFDGTVNNPLLFKTLDVLGGYDIALVVSGAYGFEVLDGPLRVGLTGKLVRRELLRQAYTAFDLVREDGIDLDGDIETGTGFGVDLGFLYTPPVILEPTLGIAVQNIGDVDLGDAGEIKQQINLGTAVHPPVPLGDVVVAFDVLDITRNIGEDDDWAKRLHLGVEYKFPMILSVRAGFNQGYFGAGTTVDFWIFKAAYAFYIEEIGAAAGQNPDRRHIFQLSLGF